MTSAENITVGPVRHGPVGEPRPAVVAFADIPSNRRRGGDLRPVLTPSTCGSTSGFGGFVTLEPGEFVSEHYHPYSEEFLYVLTGRLRVRVDGEPVEVGPLSGLLLPRNTRHRLENHTEEAVTAVFHLGPLAPRPEVGHVDTEEYPQPVEGSAG